MRNLLLILCLAAGLGVPAQDSLAAAYPSKPIDIIVPYAPGGGTDIAARLMAGYLSKKWNVPVQVINKTGGGGILGTLEAISARPDGYTMLCTAHNITIMGAFAKSLKLPFKWDNQTFISRITVDPAYYVVRPDAPWKSLRELTEYVRNNPKVVKLGASGRTGIGYLAGVQLLLENNIPVDAMNFVSFTGNAPTIAALAGSHIDVAGPQLSEMFAMYEAKKLRALAVVWDKRLAMTPDVPTVAEAGYPTLDSLGWHGISGPSGLPEDVVSTWAKALEEASRDPQFSKMAAGALKIPGYLGPKEFRQFVSTEYKRRAKLAEAVEAKN